jgi:hypothetical protein
MKRTYLFGTMMAFGLAVASVGAQDRPAASSSDQQGKSVVVTGCLKSGAQLTGSAASGTAGTTGTSGTTASGGSFILADAKVAGKTGTDSATAVTGSTAGTTGTSGTTASADKDKAKSFTLVGGTPSELQGYLNSKVEITGTIDPNASASSATTTAPAPSATGTATTPATGSMAGMAHAADQAKLRVTSVRQVAATCDASQQ